MFDVVCFFFLKIKMFHAPSNYIRNRFLCPKFINNFGDLNNSLRFFFIFLFNL